MSYKNISYHIDDKIVYIGFGQGEKKSMTTLSVESLTELDKALSQVEDDIEKQQVRGLIFFSHRPGCFLAGMDVHVIGSLRTESEAAKGAEQGQKLMNRIEDLPIPKIACVDGICLGGGLELSLSCDIILASNSPKTKLGLPEVMLGIIPGFGGTLRLPKKVGLVNSLDMILSGKQVPAKKALKMGLVEEVYPPERLLELAPQHLGKKRKKKTSLPDTIKHLSEDNFLTRKLIFQKARENVLKQTKGFYHAPLKILDVIETNIGKSRESYLEAEGQAFGELCVSEQSKNLQHVFFLTDATKKFPGKSAGSESKGKAVETGAVLGAGTMGGGIAWLFAQNGQKPFMKDITKEGLELGLKQASSNFSGDLRKGRMTQDEFERKQRSIRPTQNYNGFMQVDLVIEAIVENMDVKKKVFAEVEKHVRPDCLLSSNTSSLSVEEMSKALEKPERFGGLHFFNPVHKMPLVEIITHSKMSEATIEALYKWTLSVKKTPIVVKDGPGFLVNRILTPWLNEASYLLEEGIGPEALDRACLDFGMPMGPCRLLDEIGLDVMEKVGKVMYDGLGERMKPSSVSQKIAQTKCYGRKSNKGFYLYDEAGKPTGPNPEVMAVLPSGGDRSKETVMDETQIQMRCFLPMINEAARILEEGITTSAAVVDTGLIYGIGFPPFRGGLLRYADFEGPERILASMKDFENQVSQVRYKPAPLLEKLVQNKQKFYDLKA